MTVASSVSSSSTTSSSSSPTGLSMAPPNSTLLGTPLSESRPMANSEYTDVHGQVHHSLMSTAVHPLQVNQNFTEQNTVPVKALAGLAIITPTADQPQSLQQQHQQLQDQGLTQETRLRYETGYVPMEQGHPLFQRPDHTDGAPLAHRYSLPAFPQGEGRDINDLPSSLASVSSSNGVFTPYIPSSDGPIIHHRNSIAGSTVTPTVVRSRRAGSMAMVEDGPFFSNTKQFYNIYNMSQTQPYRLRVMARIDRGFFTANKIWTCYRRNYFQVSTAFTILGFDHSQGPEVPCLIELPDSLNGLETMHQDGSQRDPAAMIGSMNGLRLNDQCNSGTATGTSRLAVVTGFSICITSKIASTDKKIDLIQHTPKRDKGPQIVPGLRPIRSGGTLTLTGTGVTQQNIVTFERVQFKTATANNGKRRAAQQFYILMVDLYAHTEDGQVFMVASSQSDSLVVRGRSPGHYVDTPERDPVMTSPGTEPMKERRLSNISQHSVHHPYHSHYSGPHSRSHSVSAGAGMSVDIHSLSLSVTEGGPLSPMSPGVASEYSPTVGGGPSPPFFQFPTQHAWTDGSSMSSPTSTYDGSGFSSPTTAYPSFQSYQGQTHASQEQSHQSYFTQRQPSFGSITPRLMMGSTGPNAGHPFDNRLETTLEHSLEGGEGGQSTSMYYQQGQSYDNSPSGQQSQVSPNQQGTPANYAGYPYHRSSHSLPIAQTDTNGSITAGHPFVKIEEQDGYFPYSTGYPLLQVYPGAGN